MEPKNTNFFKPLVGAKLWLVGLLALVILSALTFAIPMRAVVAERVTGSLLGSKVNQHDHSFSLVKANGLKDALWVPLTYFGGVNFSERDEGLGLIDVTSMTTSSNSLVGGLVLILAFLLACAVTRKSSSAWLAVVPVWAGLLVSMCFVHSAMNDTGAKLGWVSLFFWMLVIPLVAALIANRLAVWLASRGVWLFDMVDAEEQLDRPRFCPACGGKRLTRNRGAYVCRGCRSVVSLSVGRIIQCSDCEGKIPATAQFCPWCGLYLRKDPVSSSAVAGSGWGVGV